MRYANEADEADLPGPYLFTPQSDWLGGDSDNPRNHGLREPVCVPGLRRSFTRKEIATVQGRCHGPCDWSYSI